VTISSRTPEGSPNECPVCRAGVCVEPSRPPGDAPCPSCGTLLWFVAAAHGAMLFDAETVDALRERLLEFISKRMGVPKDRLSSSTSFVEALGVDSLDIVVLVMQLEEEFGVTIPDGEAERMRTLDDFLMFLLRSRSE
jgi:acyl carrier protein